MEAGMAAVLVGVMRLLGCPYDGAWCLVCEVLHGESITDQASPRTPTQRTFQPQEAVQPQRNQTILQADTPAQKANYSYRRSHPTPLEADAHTSHVHSPLLTVWKIHVSTSRTTVQLGACA